MMAMMMKKKDDLVVVVALVTLLTRETDQVIKSQNKANNVEKLSPW